MQKLYTVGIAPFEVDADSPRNALAQAIVEMKQMLLAIPLEEIMFEVTDEDGNCESVTLGYGDA